MNCERQFYPDLPRNHKTNEFFVLSSRVSSRVGVGGLASPGGFASVVSVLLSWLGVGRSVVFVSLCMAL